MSAGDFPDRLGYLRWTALATDDEARYSLCEHDGVPRPRDGGCEKWVQVFAHATSGEGRDRYFTRQRATPLNRVRWYRVRASNEPQDNRVHALAVGADAQRDAVDFNIVDSEGDFRKYAINGQRTGCPDREDICCADFGELHRRRYRNESKSKECGMCWRQAVDDLACGAGLEVKYPSVVELEIGRLGKF